MKKELIKESIRLVTESQEEMFKNAIQLLHSPDDGNRQLALELMQSHFEKSFLDSFFIKEYPFFSKGKGFDFIIPSLKKIQDGDDVQLVADRFSVKDFELIRNVRPAAETLSINNGFIDNGVSLKEMKLESIRFNLCNNAPIDILSNDNVSSIILDHMRFANGGVDTIGSNLEFVTIIRDSSKYGTAQRLCEINAPQKNGKDVMLEFLESEMDFGSYFFNNSFFSIIYFDSCQIRLTNNTSAADNKTIKSIYFVNTFVENAQFFVETLTPFEALEYINLVGCNVAQQANVLNKLKEQFPNATIKTNG